MGLITAKYKRGKLVHDVAGGDFGLGFVVGRRRNSQPVILLDRNISVIFLEG